MQGGGMVIFSTTKKPKKVPMDQVAAEFANKPRSEPAKYYHTDPKDRPTPKGGGGEGGNGSGWKLPDIKLGSITTVLGALVLLAFIFLLGFLDGKGKEKAVQRILICTIVVLTLITTILAVRAILAQYCKCN